jgi:hypothetical protein
MNYSLRTLLLILLFITAGCSSIRVSQDYTPGINLSSLINYAWHDDSQEKTGDIRIDSPLVDARIRSAIDATLTARGYRKTGRDRADFHVAYRYAIRSQVGANQVQTSFGFGFGSYGRHGGVGISTGPDYSSYDEGLLIIDILDSRNGSALWRGKGTRQVFIHTEPERMTEQINETVHKILDQFPP